MDSPSDPQHYRFWFVSMAELAKRARIPIWALGMIIAFVLCMVFVAMLTGFSTEYFDDRDDYLTSLGTGLFFGLINAYILASGAYVVNRAKQTLDEIAPILTTTPDELDKARQSLEGGSLRYVSIVAIGGIVGGFTHLSMLVDGDATLPVRLFANSATTALSCGTVLTWFVITHIVSSFVAISQVFSRLGSSHTKIDLFKPEQLRPFTNISVLPALGLMGAQMLYPLLTLGGDFNTSAIAPGFVVTFGSLIYLLLTPNLGLRRKMKQLKHAAIVDVDERVDQLRKNLDLREHETLARLQVLLNHRAYLADIPEWPLGFTSLLKWSLYVIIPPLTWAAAAFMEIFIDQIVG